MEGLSCAVCTRERVQRAPGLHRICSSRSARASGNDSVQAAIFDEGLAGRARLVPGRRFMKKGGYWCGVDSGLRWFARVADRLLFDPFGQRRNPGCPLVHLDVVWRDGFVNDAIAHTVGGQRSPADAFGHHATFHQVMNHLTETAAARAALTQECLRLRGTRNHLVTCAFHGIFRKSPSALIVLARTTDASQPSSPTPIVYLLTATTAGRRLQTSESQNIRRAPGRRLYRLISDISHSPSIAATVNERSCSAHCSSNSQNCPSGRSLV